MDIYLDEEEYQTYINFKVAGFDDVVIIPHLLSLKKQLTLAKGESCDEDEEDDEAEECDFLKNIFIIPIMAM